MKTLGIIGGMGPLATADLYRKIILATDAARDQDYPHVIIDGDAQIPDRTEAILHGGENPLPRLVASARRLTAAGAEVLMMACNTAHYYYDAVQAEAGVPVLHMIEETAREVRREGYRTAALLATDGTVQTKLYHRVFEAQGIPFLLPDPHGQRAVMAMIYEGVKAGAANFDTAQVTACLRRLREAGADVFVLACTELPPAFEQYGIQAPAVDPTAVLARAAVLAAGCRLRPAPKKPTVQRA